MKGIWKSVRDRGRQPGEFGVLLALLAALWILPRSAAAADYSNFHQLESRLAFDSNVSRAAHPEDQRGDSYLQTRVTLGRRAQLNEMTRTSLTLNLRNQTHREYYGLNNTSINVTADWVRKFGVGRTPPAVRVFAEATRLEFTDPLRDGAEFAAGAMVLKPLSQRASLTALFRMDSRTAPDANVFRGHGMIFGGSLNLGLPRGATLTVGYAQRRGDVTFHCAPVPGGFVIPVSQNETTFNLIAYRRTSRTRITRTTLSLPINNRTALFAEFERQDTNWLHKNYPNDIWSLGVIHDVR